MLAFKASGCYSCKSLFQDLDLLQKDLRPPIMLYHPKRVSTHLEILLESFNSLEFLHPCSLQIVAFCEKLQMNSRILLLHYGQASKFWNMFSSFGLSYTFDLTVVSDDFFLFLDHSFKDKEKILWLHVLGNFLWCTWIEINHTFLVKYKRFFKKIFLRTSSFLLHFLRVGLAKLSVVI